MANKLSSWVIERPRCFCMLYCVCKRDVVHCVPLFMSYGHFCSWYRPFLDMNLTLWLAREYTIYAEQKKRVTMMWTSQIWHRVPHHSGEVDDLIIGLLAVRDKTSARTPSSVHWWDLQAYCQSWIRHTKHFVQTVIAYMSHNVKMCAQSAVWIKLHIYTVYTFQLKLRSEHI